MTPNHISGDELSELKRYVLEASRKILVENVDAPRFLPYFRSKFILDQRECDQIKSCSRQSRYDGAEKLLDALLTKGGSGYDHFCAAIMYDQTQMFLLTTLNKRLEILRDWRKNQVAADHQVHQAHVEMMRAQAHLNRQQQMRYSTMYPSNGRNRTYPLMTAGSSYAGQRYPSSHSVPPTGKIVSAAPYQPELHRQQNLPPPEPERLPRSPVPIEEPMTPPNTQFLPHPNHLEGPGPGGNNCYPPFTEPQIAEQGHNIMAVQQLNQSHQVYNHHHHHHPSFHPSAAQPPIPQQQQQQQQQQQAGVHHQTLGGGSYSTAASYPPQAILHGQHYPPGGCVPPTEPMYPVPVGGGAYYEHHIPPAPHHHQHHHNHHDVLTLNTPTGAMMENLLPGMPPPPVSTCAAASPHSVHPGPATGANHHIHEPEMGEVESQRLSGSSPQYTQSSYGLLLASSAAAAATTGHGYATGSPSKDILCGQGGN